MNSEVLDLTQKQVFNDMVLELGKIMFANEVSGYEFYEGRLGTRQSDFTRNPDGKRDYYKTFGYPRGEIAYMVYEDMYRREGIGAALIDAYVNDTWQKKERIYETENPKRTTKFEREYQMLEEKFDLRSIFKQADLLCNLGRYSTILIGYDDKLPLEQPLASDGESADLDKILYLRPYSEIELKILEYDPDPNTPNFGKPLYYQLEVKRELNATKHNLPFAMKVHYSRVIHIVEKYLRTPEFGIPRLERVFNDVKDHLKVKGGAAELFWYNARAGLAMILDKDAKLAKETLADGVSKSEGEFLKQQAEDFINDLTRVLRMRGGDIKNLGAEIADPSKTLDAIYTSISIAGDIPKRRLMGSEVGELASSMDAVRWSNTIGGRCETFAFNKIIKPTVNRIANTGALTMPRAFFVEWPPLVDLTEKDKGDLALQMAKVNRTNLEPVYTTAEIREVTDREPLTDEQIKELEPKPVEGNNNNGNNNPNSQNDNNQSGN